VDSLGGQFGIWQHAAGQTPDPRFGYCTDDVARALLVDLLHGRELGWKVVRGSAWRSLKYIGEAFDPATAQFRNFRSGDGTWLEAAGSEDSQGRAMLALGVTIAAEPEAAAVARARSLFVAALPHARLMTSPRAIASVILACKAALDGGLEGETREALAGLASRLRQAFASVTNEIDWPWPESALTYENALLPQAMLTAGATLDDDELRRLGLAALDWLIGVQTTPEGAFRPIGSNGWPRGGTRSQFDQQPIEATAMILAAEAAFECTHDKKYLRAVESAYGWFLGDNEVGVELADPARGSCHDGLTPDGVNLNQGAESTLMWLTALEHVRRIRAAATVSQIGDPRAAPTPAGSSIVTQQKLPKDETRELFIRHPNNPIITAQQLPYRANSVFNPGAARAGDDTVLLLRVEDLRGISHLLVARSRDGVTDWRFDKAPLLAPEPGGRPEEIWGCEDPRITWLPERNEWAIAYTAYSRLGPLVALAMTTDFTQVERLGPIMPPDDKDAALFPRRIGERWAMIHRPSPASGGAHMWLSFSPDLHHWGDHQMLLEARDGAWWDAGKIGLGPPPLETRDGWLVCYHGAHTTASGPLYRVGLALLDLDDPRVVLRRTDEWLLGPTAPYERVGDVNKVVFPTGWVLDEKSETLSMYYGAGDSVVALATARLDDLLDYMRHAVAPRHRRATDPIGG
jgi:beta-1,4-mannooligosaccharide/beta-1,4-mannosyl-N-acetylglucosamine phosphorylase